MPSEKLTRILRAKSPFSDDEIVAMPDAEGWKWVYANRPVPRDDRHQICFTGFSAPDAAELQAIAAGSSWLRVTTSVTTQLAFLCTGDTPGPAKLAKAAQQGVTILSRAEFLNLLADGELPTRAEA